MSIEECNGGAWTECFGVLGGGVSGGRDGEAERGLEKVNRELPPSVWKVGGGEKKQLTYSTSDLSVQGYPTITPRIPFPFFPHNVQPRPMTTISDFLAFQSNSSSSLAAICVR
jgi:hypothetical protein